MALRIGFIAPPYDFSRFSESPHAPLGIASIAAILERSGYFVRILDTRALNLGVKETINWVKESDFDVIGISMASMHLETTKEIVKKIRHIGQIKVPIVVGGPHPTADPIGTLKTTNADIAVVGEGEMTMLDLVKNLKNLQKVKGIYYKKGEEILLTKPRELIEDLDSLPMPARHLLPMDRYKPFPGTYRKERSLQMIVSRGCPYNCIFCLCIFGKRYRKRSPKKVIQEIKQLIKNYNAKEIYFWDDILTLDKNWMNKLCDLMIKEKLNIEWSGSTRVDQITPKLLRKMRKAGCFRLNLGIESGDQRVLKIIRKNMTIEQIKKAFKMCKEAGIEIAAYYILGLPGDNKESCLRTIKLARKLNAEISHFNIAIPFPGTDFYKDLKKYGDYTTKILPTSLMIEQFLHLMG